MSFVNEYVSKENYHLSEIESNFIVGRVRASEWTVDKEKNMFLLLSSRGREEFFYDTRWTFCWEGEIVIFNHKVIKSRRDNDDHLWQHVRIEFEKFPEVLKISKKQVLKHIEEALKEYKGAGIRSSRSNYELKLKVEGV